jgi:hypothetical protein
LTVEHFGGTAECKTLEELEKILKIRYGTGVNEYWICEEGEENPYPWLAVLINNEYATLTYFPDEGHPGYQSVGKNTDLDEYTIFYVNTPTEEIEVANKFIVPFSKALEAIKEYFLILSIPNCLEWNEL